MAKKIKPEDQVGYTFAPEEYESPGMKRMQEKLTARAIELLDLEEGKILDIGCGSGFSTQVLYDYGFDVVGIDPNEEMVNKAKERKLDCVVGSFEKIPFESQTFDGIISISALQWADYKKAAKEVSRVLKNKAKAVMQFYPESEKDAIRAARLFADQGFKTELAIDNPENPKKKKIFLLLDR